MEYDVGFLKLFLSNVLFTYYYVCELTLVLV